MSTKHKNYYTLNLLGYGLAKFGMNFVLNIGFNTKKSFYEHLVNIGVAETSGVIKNRQDLFDPFFKNKRKGWWQKGNTYIHRKTFIDSLFGELNALEYADIIKLHLCKEFSLDIVEIKPIVESKFKQLQQTGIEAELFFLHNYLTIDFFKKGVIEDARLYGDGYDFQIQVENSYYLTEVKGVREKMGSVRLTEKEFYRAKEHENNYVLSVVSDLNNIPKITTIFNPLSEIELAPIVVESKNISYHSKSLIW
jgi:hypothetical protein